MKAQLIYIALSIVTLFSGLAQAEVSTRYKLIAADGTTESNLCVVAATEGYNQARKQAFEQGVFLKKNEGKVLCNGKDIYRFARKFRNQNVINSVVALAK